MSQNRQLAREKSAVSGTIAVELKSSFVGQDVYCLAANLLFLELPL